MDAYHKALQDRGAAWAAKKYRGHQGVPMTILDDYDDVAKAGKA
jgi:hypothetical protein